MQWFKFLLEYIKSPRAVGAIAPSSSKLAEKMTGDIDFDQAKCIIEYGPGTGVFSDKLAEGKKKDTLLILVEYNEEFCKKLREKYKNQSNILVVNDSAENIEEYLDTVGVKEVDYVVSGLPFASLPKKISTKILDTTKTILKEDGVFITFQYTLLKKDFISYYFHNINYDRVLLNIPPAYVLKCHNI